MGKLTSLRPAIGVLPGRLGHQPDRAAGANAGEIRRQQNQAADRQRGSRHERGYGARWVKASKAHRAEHPLCAYCQAGAFGPAKITAATLTDHLYPQRQHPGVFWERAWWVSCCADCHNGPKQALEHRGKTAIDELAQRLGRPIL